MFYILCCAQLIMKAILDPKKYQQGKVVVSQIINQAEVDLVGGIWTDQNGKIHFVGLTVSESGDIVIDFPDMKSVYIADVAQVGLKR